MSKQRGKGKSQGQSPGIPVLSVVAHTILGFIFWSNTTHHPDVVFFFPLLKMSFTGLEAFAAAPLLVALLGFSRVQAFVEKAQLIFKILSVAGLATCYLDAYTKIVYLAVCVVGGWYVLCAGVFVQSSRDPTIYGHVLGLLALLSLRFANVFICTFFFW